MALNKIISITTIDNLNLKRDCEQGSLVNGLSQAILYTFGLDVAPWREIIKTPEFKHYKKLKKISTHFSVREVMPKT